MPFWLQTDDMYDTPLSPACLSQVTPNTLYVSPGECS